MRSETQQSQQPIYITNNVVVANQKSTLVAYLLWFFLGQLGIHKFYLNKTFMGLTYLGLGVLGWATTLFFVGWFFLAVLWIMLIIDIFTIPGSVAKINNRGTSIAQM